MDIMESFLYAIRVTSYPVTNARKNGIFLTGWQTLFSLILATQILFRHGRAICSGKLVSG